jgi:hypothetical protein
MKWSMGYHLEIEDVKLRDKKWVEFIERNPDKNAVADQFYQSVGKGSKVKKFKGGQVELILELDFEKYRKIIEHRELEEEKRQGVEEKSVTVVPVGQKRHRATLGDDDGPGPSRPSTSNVYTADSEAIHTFKFPTPTLLPPSLIYQATSIHDIARVNRQKAAKITLHSSVKGQDTLAVRFLSCAAAFSSQLLIFRPVRFKL